MQQSMGSARQIHSEEREVERAPQALQAGSSKHKADEKAISRAVRQILIAVGEDPDREGLRDTPDRVARMYAEILSGLHLDPARHLRKFFTEKYDEMLVIRDITFASLCEHHLLPFTGAAHVGYLPKGRIVGLSKLARVVEEVSRRPQVQERMTEEIADLMMRELDAKGVAVVIDASHSCMAIRGIRKATSSCVTSAMRGSFKTQQATREEFFSLIHNRSR